MRPLGQLLDRLAVAAPLVGEPEQAEEPDRETWFARHGVPRRYRHPFESPDPPPLAERRRRGDPISIPWSDWTGDPWSLFLVGPTGTGKSFIAAETLWRWRRGWWVAAAAVPAIHYNEAEAAAWNRLCSTPLLVIDELGRDHQGGGWEAVGRLVSSRYDDERATIVTSNLAAREFDARAGGILDRLAAGLTIRMTGESRR